MELIVTRSRSRWLQYSAETMLFARHDHDTGKPGNQCCALAERGYFAANHLDRYCCKAACQRILGQVQQNLTNWIDLLMNAVVEMVAGFAYVLLCAPPDSSILGTAGFRIPA